MALVKNLLFARYFNRFGARREERGNRELRREMLAGLSGRVIEVGPGNGWLLPCPDVPGPALARIPARVCAAGPGGQLRFYEHVRSRDAVFARYQKAADLIWPHLMGGCHTDRRTLAAIGQVFTISECRGFSFPPLLLPTSRQSPRESSAWPAGPLLPRFDHEGGPGCLAWLSGAPELPGRRAAPTLSGPGRG